IVRKMRLGSDAPEPLGIGPRRQKESHVIRGRDAREQRLTSGGSQLQQFGELPQQRGSRERAQDRPGLLEARAPPLIGLVASQQDPLNRDQRGEACRAVRGLRGAIPHPVILTDANDGCQIAAAQMNPPYHTITKRDFLEVTVGLAVVILLILGLQLEGIALMRVAVMAGAAFAVPALVPLRWRMPLFCATGVAAFVVTLGAIHASVLLALSAALLVLCHLPLPFWGRIVLALAFGLGFVGLRAAGQVPPTVATVVPVLA